MSEIRQAAVSFRDVTLEKLRLSLRNEIGRALIENGSLEACEDFLRRRLVMEFRTHVLAEKMGTKEVRYPRDWLEAVKERFAPAWALRRWPVVYTVRRFKAMLAYPDFVPSVRGQTTFAAFVQEPTEQQ